jgi:hypothetical protein
MVFSPEARTLRNAQHLKAMQKRLAQKQLLWDLLIAGVISVPVAVLFWLWLGW